MFLGQDMQPSDNSVYQVPSNRPKVTGSYQDASASMSQRGQDGTGQKQSMSVVSSGAHPPQNGIRQSQVRKSTLDRYISNTREHPDFRPRLMKGL